MQNTSKGFRLSIAIGILGILFKLMHWPFASVLLITGILGISIFYSISFYKKSPKRFLDYSKLLLLLSFLVQYTIRIFHLPYGNIFQIIFLIAFVLMVIAYFKEVFFSEEKDEINPVAHRKKTIRDGISYLLYGIAAVGIILGAQFKILHWEFGFITGNVLLTIGLLAVIVSIILGLKDSE